MSGLASASNLRIAQRNEDIAGSYNQLFTCHVRVCAADNRRRFINKMILKSFHHFKTLSFESPPVPSNVNKKKRNYHWIWESDGGGERGRGGSILAHSVDGWIYRVDFSGFILWNLKPSFDAWSNISVAGWSVSYCQGRLYLLYSVNLGAWLSYLGLHSITFVCIQLMCSPVNVTNHDSYSDRTVLTWFQTGRLSYFQFVVDSREMANLACRSGVRLLWIDQDSSRASNNQFRLLLLWWSQGLRPLKPAQSFRQCCVYIGIMWIGLAGCSLQVDDISHPIIKAESERI